MYPYNFYPVYDDYEYEQYARAPQSQQQARQRRQAYEQQQYQEYLRHQYYEQQQHQQQQQLRARAYREYQLREQERLHRLAREREAKRQRQVQAQLEAQRRRQQEAENRRRCQQEAQQRRLLAEQQALREQFISRHEDGPITLSLFDVLDHIQRQQQHYEREASKAELHDNEEAGDHDTNNDWLRDRLEALLEPVEEPVDEPAEEPTIWYNTNDPRVSEPPSPPVEVVEDELARVLEAASLDTAPVNEIATKQKEQQTKNQNSDEADDSEILRTIKPRLDLEIERFEGIVSKSATDADSAKLKLRNLKQAHMRVEAIYEQLDESRVSRKLRSQKHSLTSTAVQLADKVDDAISDAQAEVSKFSSADCSAQAPGRDSGAAPGSPSSTASGSAKHHVTLEEVDE